MSVATVAAVDPDRHALVLPDCGVWDLPAHVGAAAGEVQAVF
jgi:hypothetical protein